MLKGAIGSQTTEAAKYVSMETLRLATSEGPSDFKSNELYLVAQNNDPRTSVNRGG